MLLYKTMWLVCVAAGILTQGCKKQSLPPFLMFDRWQLWGITFYLSFPAHIWASPCRRGIKLHRRLTPSRAPVGRPTPNLNKHQSHSPLPSPKLLPTRLGADSALLKKEFHYVRNNLFIPSLWWMMSSVLMLESAFGVGLISSPVGRTATTWRWWKTEGGGGAYDHTHAHPLHTAGAGILRVP